MRKLDRAEVDSERPHKLLCSRDPHTGPGKLNGRCTHEALLSCTTGVLQLGRGLAADRSQQPPLLQLSSRGI